MIRIIWRSELGASGIYVLLFEGHHQKLKALPLTGKPRESDYLQATVKRRCIAIFMMIILVRVRHFCFCCCATRYSRALKSWIRVDGRCLYYSRRLKMVTKFLSSASLIPSLSAEAVYSEAVRPLANCLCLDLLWI